MSPSFVHLHIHSDYSLIDSTIRLPEKAEPGATPRANLIDQAVALGMPALALTDQSNQFALVKFFKAAQYAGIKPIIGADLWIADASDAARPTRITLLCQNREGYLNLSRLISRGWVEGQRGDFAMLQPEWFDHACGGLIGLLGRDSDLGRLLLADKRDAIASCAQHWLQRFDDRLYLELTRTGHADEEHFLQAALQLANARDIAAVASNDVRFLTRDDYEAHEARVCIQQGRVINDPKRPRDYTAEQYLKSPEEMAVLFADLPEALENSIQIAKRCNLDFSFGTYFLPAFPTPPSEDEPAFLRRLSREGLAGRIDRYGIDANFAHADYVQRLETELDVIVKMGFPGYFLIVADFINWAKQHGIPVGPGRGSGAGSLVAYALGITDLDPLRYGLLFERFLNPDRVSMPDFDVDFCMDRRDEVIDYVAQKYGRERVSQIITYGTMAAKAVIRDCGRVLGMGYGHVDGIAKLIPNTLGISLEGALKESQDLRTRYVEEEEIKDLLDLALKLEDLTRNAGKHAGGVVIAPTPLTDFAPLYCEAGGGGVVTQFDKDDVEAVGLVKFDFLGLRTLTIIDWAVKAINLRLAKTGQTPLDITQLPLDDPAVFALLKKAQSVAVFQFESRGMQALLKDAKPDRFEDLIALVSLFRPGPMDLIPSFCARKHGREAVTYPDARVEPILSETYGIMVYQEQVMQMAQIVGGYTLGGADLLRRAMGKKNVQEMANHRAIFAEGAAKNGLSNKQADAIFDLMEKFAGYGFNKSHAAAYALIAYQTAWLKAHYPAEFMAAVLSADMDNTDKVVTFLDEARALGLRVAPPDVNTSGYMFEALSDGSVCYGLGAIKGVGHGVCDAIVHARRTGSYLSITDFCQRMDLHKLNKRVLEALVLSGSMDGLARNRATLMAQLPEAIKTAEQAARNTAAGQNDMFGSSSAVAAPQIDLPTVEEWPIEQKLIGERETLGHYLSGHPTDAWRDALVQLSTCPLGEIAQHYKPVQPSERRGRFSDQPFIVAGQVIAVRKRGDAMGFVQLEDWSGRIEVSFYREAFVEFGPLLTRDTILVIEGGLSIDDFNGGYQLRARTVHSLNQACERFARVMRIKLNGIDASFVAQLEHTLAAHRGGNTPLRLSYANGSGRAEIELGAEWRVRASPELKRALENLPGVIGSELVLSKPVAVSNNSGGGGN